MADNIRIQGRPQVGGSRRTAPQLDVAARVHDYGTSSPPVDADLAGLIRGLESFNPALQRYGAQQDAFNREDGAQAGRVAAAKADLTGTSPEGVTVPAVDPQLPPAYGASFGEAFKVATAHRLGIAAKSEALDEYEKVKGTEGFNPEGWLAERRQKVLTGINDPDIAEVMGQHFGQVEQGILGDIHKQRIQQRDQVRLTTMTQIANDAFTAEMSPDEWAAKAEWFTGQSQALQFDKGQTAAFLLQRAVAVSQEQNGMPELFDMFDKRDKDGMSPTEANPALKAQVAQARAQAKAMTEKFVNEKLEPEFAQKLIGYEGDIDRNPGAVTMERIISDMGQYGAIKSPQQAASLWARAQAAMQSQAAQGALMGSADNGTLWVYKPEDQKKALDAKFGGMVQGLVQASTGNDPAAIASLAAQLMKGQSSSGSTEGISQLERFIQTGITNLPNTQGPSPSFQAVSAIYRAFSADPKFRSMYFKEDTAKLMEAFTHAQDSGLDPKTAHAEAYKSISPEAKAAAEARGKDPKFQAMVKDRALKMTEGSSFVPRWLFGNGRPENTAPVGMAAKREAEAFLLRNPDASDDIVKQHIDTWASQNYVMDETTNAAVRVPPGTGGALLQQALTNYSKDFSAQLRAANRLTEDTQLRYSPTGTEGQLMVQAWDGAASRDLGLVNVQQLMARERSARVLTPDERAQLGAVKQAMIDGTPLPQVDPAILGKARHLGEDLAEVDKRYTQAFLARAKEVPTLSFGAPSMDGIAFGQSKGPGRIDRQLTATVARQFLSGPAASQNHQGLAASLITASEEVMLSPYGDPAKGAGQNIGMGYNLKANAATVNNDLKRAGVPEDLIEEVKAGRRELIPDQAKRLLLVSLPRYEKQASAAAEETQPGLWQKMTPAQRAVMIDVAWQVGDPSQFKKAWASLARGDAASFATETKVFFTNQKGERVEDVRRGKLRANMLAGIETWDATLQRIGAVPSSRTQTASK